MPAPPADARRAEERPPLGIDDADLLDADSVWSLVVDLQALAPSTPRSSVSAFSTPRTSFSAPARRTPGPMQYCLSPNASAAALTAFLPLPGKQTEQVDLQDEEMSETNTRAQPVPPIRGSGKLPALPRIAEEKPQSLLAFKREYFAARVPQFGSETAEEAEQPRAEDLAHIVVRLSRRLDETESSIGALGETEELQRRRLSALLAEALQSERDARCQDFDWLRMQLAESGLDLLTDSPRRKLCSSSSTASSVSTRDPGSSTNLLAGHHFGRSDIFSSSFDALEFTDGAREAALETTREVSRHVATEAANAAAKDSMRSLEELCSRLAFDLQELHNQVRREVQSRHSELTEQIEPLFASLGEFQRHVSSELRAASDELLSTRAEASASLSGERDAYGLDMLEQQQRLTKEMESSASRIFQQHWKKLTDPLAENRRSDDCSATPELRLQGHPSQGLSQPCQFQQERCQPSKQRQRDRPYDGAPAKASDVALETKGRREAERMDRRACSERALVDQLLPEQLFEKRRAEFQQLRNFGGPTEVERPRPPPAARSHRGPGHEGADKQALEVTEVQLGFASDSRRLSASPRRISERPLVPPESTSRSTTPRTYSERHGAVSVRRGPGQSSVCGMPAKGSLSPRGSGRF